MRFVTAVLPASEKHLPTSHREKGDQVTFLPEQYSATHVCPLLFEQHRNLMMLYSSAMPWHSSAACFNGVRQ